MRQINPLMKMDYPDPDVIRVEDTYYLVSTTMHFFPGGSLLKSYNLVDWEIAGYLFDTLDDTRGERLVREHVNYGGGMWAPCIRYHEGKFYVIFGSHTGEGCTHLYIADSIEGPWEHRVFKEYYHDCSLLFDDDGRVYLTYGNRDIHLQEMNADLSGPKEDGLSRVIIRDSADIKLGYEGSHFQKIGGHYYVFLVHWEKDACRTESVYRADNLEGEFIGRDVLAHDRGYYGQGVAQGGVVDTPDGKWYGVLFQDSGAVGRIPVLVPVTWEDGWPVFGSNGIVNDDFELPKVSRAHTYEPLFTSDFSDDYSAKPIKMAKQWQWNHRPNNDLWYLSQEGKLTIGTDKLSINVTHAKNTLTQRLLFPGCVITVTVDASELNDGDFAGICALQSLYGTLAVSKEAGRFYLNEIVRDGIAQGWTSQTGDCLPGKFLERVALDGPVVRLRMIAEFSRLKDTIHFQYENEKGRFVKVGTPHKIAFMLDHFAGNRVGLFVYSTREIGGKVTFSDFSYLPG